MKIILFFIIFSSFLFAQQSWMINGKTSEAERDSIPAQFQFPDVINANLSTLYTSNGAMVTNFDSAWAYAGGGEYRINSGSWITAKHKIFNNDVLYTRITSSSSYNTAVTITVSVAGVNDTYSVTTRQTSSQWVYGTHAHFVSLGGAGSKNGTWGNDFDFPSITWSGLSALDTLYVDGGADSVVYASLTVGSSGSSSGLFVIRPRRDAGHNGRVIINPNHSDGITISNRHYLKLEKLEVTNCATGIYGYSSSDGAGSNVYIDSCIVTNFGLGAGASQRGIWLTGYQSGLGNDARLSIVNAHIRWNTVISPTYSTSETDCIYGQSFKSMYIEGNIMVNRNTHTPSQHCDGVQMQDYTNVYVYNNEMYQLGDNTEDNRPDQGYIFGIYDSTTVLYGNFVYMPGYGLPLSGGQYHSYSNTVLFKDPVKNSNAHCYCYNNTIVSGQNYNGMIVNVTTNIDFKNNIFYSLQCPITAFHYTNVTDKSRVDYNLYYYGVGVTQIASLNGNKTLSQLRTAGSELHGLNTNPLLVDYTQNGVTQSGSPARNAGVNLQGIIEGLGLPWKDKNGIDRTTTPDIGCYEYH